MKISINRNRFKSESAVSDAYSIDLKATVLDRPSSGPAGEPNEFQKYLKSISKGLVGVILEYPMGELDESGVIRVYGSKADINKFIASFSNGDRQVQAAMKRFTKPVNFGPVFDSYNV